MSSETARRLVRRAIFPAVEHVWAGAAWLAGRALRAPARAEPWSPAGGPVLVVAAHPDDETLGLGGTIALHAQAGDDVTVVVLTDGSASRADGLAPSEMARRRRNEAEAAAGALGITRPVCLGLPEGRWSATSAEEALRPLVDAAKVVYTPSCVDYHPEHVRVAGLVSSLVKPDQLVRIYELGVPLTPVLANCLADTGAVAHLVAQARGAYGTQRVSTSPFARLARYRARLYGLDAAEVFCQLPGGAYTRLMALGDWRDEPTPFFGIRPRPFTDPLTALAGRRARSALRRAVLAG